MDYDKEDYCEIARHIIPWFRHEAARHLSITNKDRAVWLLQNMITNLIHGGGYHVSSGPHNRITVKEWYDDIEKLGCQEAINQGYWVLRKEYVSEKQEDLLREFASILFVAIGEVCHGRNWAVELNDHNGNQGGWFSEWIEINKSLFKRTFWRLWKQHQRQQVNGR